VRTIRLAQVVYVDRGHAPIVGATAGAAGRPPDRLRCPPIEGHRRELAGERF
jgi:hypothetical protein